MRKDNSLFYSFSSKSKQELGVFSFLLVLLIIFRLEGVLNINRYFLGSIQGDAGIYLWLMKTNLRDLISLPWFEKAAFYPYSKVLAWTDNFILPSLVAKPLFLLGLSDHFVMNSTVLFASLLNGYLTYRLSFKLSGELFASFFAGAVLMTLPYFTHMLGHPQMLFFFFVPLSISLLVSYLNSPSFLAALKFTMVIFFSFLTTVSIAVFSAAVSALFLFCVIVLRSKRVTLRELKPLAAATTISLALLCPFCLPYLDVKNAFGERQLYEAYYFAADILSYISSTPFNLLYGTSQSLSHSEAHLFPGITIPILGIMALGRLAEAKKLKLQITFFWLTFLFACTLSTIATNNFFKAIVSLLLWLSIFQGGKILYTLGKLERKLRVDVITARDLIGIFLFITLIFFMVTLGPLGNPEKGQLAAAPYTFFYYAFPGFSSIRAVGRAGSLALFSLIMAASIYLSIVYKKRIMRGIAYIAFLFCLIENFNLFYPMSVLPPMPENTAILRSQSEGAAIYLPFAGELDRNNEVASWSEYAERNITYLLWSSGDSRPLVNGYSGQKTKIMREFPRELKDFPSQRSLNALGTIAGLKYVIYAPLFDEGFNEPEFAKRITDFPTQLKLISKDRDGTYLFELTPELHNAGHRPILIPAGDYKLAFDIRTAFNSGKELVKVNEFDIPGDGSWRNLEKAVPQSYDNVRPRQVSLTSEEVPLSVKNIKLLK